MQNRARLTSERTKQILRAYLATDGWKLGAAWGASHGIDIDARRNGARWIIEVGIPQDRACDVAGTFVSAVGKILQRMQEPAPKYSIAVPDTEPFHRLWERLPVLVKKRIGLTVLFVDMSGSVVESTD